jgi:hypothetical protein
LKKKKEIMSAEYKNVDLNKIAQDAERDLNSDAAKKGHGDGPSSTFVFYISPFPPLTFPFITHLSLPMPPFPFIHCQKSTTQNQILTSLPVSDSGVDESVTTKFPGSTVEYGTGASNNRTIPESEGGSINPATGKLYKAGEYAHGGVGAPEEHKKAYARNHGGEDNVRGNTVDGASLRQTGATE